MDSHHNSHHRSDNANLASDHNMADNPIHSHNQDIPIPGLPTKT